MMSGKRLFVSLLSALSVIGVLILVQGCGGGGETEQAVKSEPQAAKQETAKPAGEMKQQAEPHTEELAVAAYTCAMHPEATSLEPGKCGVCGMDLEETKAEYTCTMCEGVHQHKPGKCSKCDMDLVLRPVPEKKEAESAH